MTNFLLGEMEEMRPWIIPVDPFNSESSAARNLAPMKEALRFLRQGGALAIFPSGEVAHYKPGRGVQESPWSSHVGALVRRTQATVLPVFFEGRNSAVFQAAGLLHPLLRTTLLFRELFSRTRETVEVRVGQPIPFTKLKKFEDDESLTRFLRLHTFILSQRPKTVVKTRDLANVEMNVAQASPPKVVPAPVPALLTSTQADFDALVKEFPAIGTKLYNNLLLTVTERIRRTSEAHWKTIENVIKNEKLINPDVA